MAGLLSDGSDGSVLTAYQPTFREQATDWLRRQLFTDDRAGQEKAERLSNWGEVMIPPYGIANQMYDIGRAGGEGDYATAGLLGAMAVLPGAAGKMKIRAYHGSPHSFDKFSMDKIGTGEGAQAYGHGLYFAQNEGIAKSYRDGLSSPPTAAQEEAQRAIHQYGDASTAADEIAKAAKQGGLLPETVDHYKTVEAILRGEAPASPGSMYEVEINADPAHFLDWDKPLSGDAPQAVKDAFNKIANSDPILKEKFHQAFRDQQPGNIYYSILNDHARTGDIVRNQTFATDKLKKAGIPGIKYLDAGSRVPSRLAQKEIDGWKEQLDYAQSELAKAKANGERHRTNYYEAEVKRAQDGLARTQKEAEGTRNYVVFNDNLINIIRKYGIAGLLGGSGLYGMTNNEAQAGAY